MCWGDISLFTEEHGREYLQFTERQTKTRSGENPRDVRLVKPKMWANTQNPDRCPISVYKTYADKRPYSYSNADHPFYIATTTVHLPSLQEKCFKRNPVGVNKLACMLKRMVKQAGMNPDKRLSNHSARKYLVQKLNDNNIPPNQIMQISGHRNIASINNYSHINPIQHRNISQILHSNSNENTSMNYTLNPTTQQSTSLMSNESRSNFHVTGGIQSIFSGPIHGGTFNVHIHQHANEAEPSRKRIRCIESDTDSE